MTPIQNMISDVVKKLEKIKEGKCVEVLTYKRDRKVVVEKLNDGYNLYEDGFEEKEFLNKSIEEVKKLLKEIQKREFPRSNIARISIINSYNKKRQ